LFELQVIKEIGPEKFCGISSDSTGNTRKARELVAKELPTIIIVPDCCHHLNNTVKDIQRLPYFSDVSLASLVSVLDST
jgi:hypothetical protein